MTKALESLEHVTLGQIADHFAERDVFHTYQQTKAENTLRRQRADLALFAGYLEQVSRAVRERAMESAATGSAGTGRVGTGEREERAMESAATGSVGTESAGMESAGAGNAGAGEGAGIALMTDPQAWAGVTWGLVERFRQWMLAEGYAVSSVNIRLSTVRTYARLAMQAGVLSAETFTKIQAVTGFSRKEARQVDQKRLAQGHATRVGAKKAAPVVLTKYQAHLLRTAGDLSDPVGARDALIMRVFLDLGLRVGELVNLTPKDFSLHNDVEQARAEEAHISPLYNGTLTFYREKVDRVQTLELTPGIIQAYEAYQRYAHRPDHAPLLVSARKGGYLTTTPMDERAVTRRVAYYGQRYLGVEHLGAHDLRHTLFTLLARQGTPVDRLMDIGGWASYKMVLETYVEPARVANQGIFVEWEEES